MRNAGVPTAKYRTFTNLEGAKQWVRDLNYDEGITGSIGLQATYFNGTLTGTRSR